MKLCNQIMVKDDYRNMRYTGTMRCACCGEESHLPEKFPFALVDMIEQMKAFSKVHDIKGCNDKKVDIPEWASKEINFSLA